MANRRGLLAGVLAFVYPGLGHIYLRAWVRAIAWFGLSMAVAALVIPDAAYQAIEARGVQGAIDAGATIGPRVMVSLLAVRVFCTLDAYILAVKESSPAAATDDDAAVCPACGNELDEELEFCPWCTQRLERPGELD
ncbi:MULTISPECIES: zinc ribbon domain-containing protein [Halobacterium]|uniref:Small CPxCG-related zinc finger protein n=5 Tax=Halobacterium salinarum TaxID=2242 RepID=A0A510N4F0_HALSA|nr:MULTISPECIES: zinc ribbon domain-containing protein [Halobacterium]MBB6090734.1 putative paraquat-inducible protein A [Halobacterium salinarum]MDL0120133.1 zinc ribbon domain-containing protein [Halobacterium salinarum]MDL0121493.1 zinc ribbon domain-containing protein [Halobacterium salinarum]MDL0123793.1 zinc ribbon domain-containing protein [Halobacterium salinarum]MDL0128583.1 zinc ribbon domain-containing protein [Halobacterium salinarum]